MQDSDKWNFEYWLDHHWRLLVVFEKKRYFLMFPSNASYQKPTGKYCHMLFKTNLGSIFFLNVFSVAFCKYKNNTRALVFHKYRLMRLSNGEKCLLLFYSVNNITCGLSFSRYWIWHWRLFSFLIQLNKDMQL